MPPARSFFVVFVVAVLLATFTRTFVVQAFRIPSDSMAPALVEGDHVLVNRFIYAAAYGPGEGLARRLLPARPVRRGDVAVFRSPPGALVIKRCLGLPGDTVEVASHRLRIGGVALDERGYLHRSRARPSSGSSPSFGPAAVPAGHYFCLGDHRGRSRDSREWGPVADDALHGRAVLIYWSIRPPDRREGPASWDKMIVRWWTGYRWDRIFQLVR